MTLRDIVFEALNNAVDNGYPPQEDANDYATVCDLTDRCAGLEDVPLDDIYPLVREWKEAHPIDRQ